MKSILRYPGGKTRAIKILKNYLPKGTKEICSPFFGGGSFELYLEELGTKVYAYDNSEILCNFWNTVRTDSEKVFSILDSRKDIILPYFKLYQKWVMDKDIGNIERAALFYILNRCSFSGTILKGGMSKGHPRYNETARKRLLDFKTGIEVNNLPFEESLPKHDCLVYADPPYIIEGDLYQGHKDFDHDMFAAEIDKKDQIILCYNDCDYIRDTYKHRKIETVQWKYGMNSSKNSNEVIIT